MKNKVVPWLGVRMPSGDSFRAGILKPSSSGISQLQSYKYRLACGQVLLSLAIPKTKP